MIINCRPVWSASESWFGNPMFCYPGSGNPFTFLTVSQIILIQIQMWFHSQCSLLAKEQQLEEPMFITQSHTLSQVTWPDWLDLTVYNHFILTILTQTFRSIRSVRSYWGHRPLTWSSSSWHQKHSCIFTCIKTHFILC